MTTIRDEVLADLDEARGIIASLGLRRYGVTVRIRTFPSGRVGDGTSIKSDTILTPTPRVRVLREAEVASSGGTFRTGDFRVDKITPAFSIPGTVTAAIVGAGTIVPDMLVPDAGLTAGQYAVVVQIVLGGAIGVATFRVSKDGGSTFGATLTTAATYQVPGIGTQLSFGGSFLAGDQVSFPVAAGGYTPAQLNPAPRAGQDRVYIVNGDNSDDMVCSLVGSLDFARAFGYAMLLRPRRESPST